MYSPVTLGIPCRRGTGRATTTPRLVPTISRPWQTSRLVTDSRWCPGGQKRLVPRSLSSAAHTLGQGPWELPGNPTDPPECSPGSPEPSRPAGVTGALATHCDSFSWTSEREIWGASWLHPGRARPQPQDTCTALSALLGRPFQSRSHTPAPNRPCKSCTSRQSCTHTRTHVRTHAHVRRQPCASKSPPRQVRRDLTGRTGSQCSPGAASQGRDASDHLRFRRKETSHGLGGEVRQTRTQNTGVQGLCSFWLFALLCFALQSRL